MGASTLRNLLIHEDFGANHTKVGALETKTTTKTNTHGILHIISTCWFENVHPVNIKAPNGFECQHTIHFKNLYTVFYKIVVGKGK